VRKLGWADSLTLPLQDREIQDTDAIENVILLALDEQPFVSLRQIAKRVLVPMSTVRDRLISKMAHKLKYYRWVSHRLSEAQRQTRVTTRKHLLDLLHSIQHHGWKYLVSLEKAWFIFVEPARTNLAPGP
jgi:hypothetical protein